MSGGGTNTVTQQSVPSWMQPYYQDALGRGQQLTSGQGPQYYPGNQVAPLNPVQEQGINSTIGAATGPTASQTAQQTNQYMGSGALMNPASNPYLQDTFHQGANAIQNQLSSEFAGSGRNIIGSLPVQSDEMNNLATQLYGGAYNNGVNATNQANALAPSIDAGTYMPGQQLLGVGAGLQNQTQQNINQNVNAWNYGQQMPYSQLSYMSGLLGNNSAPFRSGSSNTTGSASPWSTAIGAGMLGNSLYSSGALSGLLGSGAIAGTGAEAAGITSGAGFDALLNGIYGAGAEIAPVIAAP